MFHDIKPLRYWCQKVIPLVYDESLSYYELLCKVVYKLNEVVEDVNSIDEYIDSVIEEKLTDEHLKELIEQFIVLYKHVITANDDGDNEVASQSWNRGTWIWLNDMLYMASKDITQGNAYIFTGDNTNVVPITVDEMTKNVYYSSAKKLSIHGVVHE